MAFDEVQFPSNISFGAIGGPGYSTDVVQMDSGFENRNQNWPQGLGKWDCSHAIKTASEIAVLLAFFRARKGKARGFRFKDWTDYQIANSQLVPTGAPTIQLSKAYTSGGITEYRAITKPVSGTLSLTYNGSPWTPSVDYTTGLASLTLLSTKTITGISKANPGSVTAVAHGFTTGDKIYIESVVGMTQVNSLPFTIIVTDADHFTIGVDTTGYTTYSSGGTAKKYTALTDTIMVVACEFDVPVRFDTDEMKLALEFVGVLSWGTVPLIETRDIA